MLASRSVCWLHCLSVSLTNKFPYLDFLSTPLATGWCTLSAVHNVHKLGAKHRMKHYLFGWVLRDCPEDRGEPGCHVIQMAKDVTDVDGEQPLRLRYWRLLGWLCNYVIVTEMTVANGRHAVKYCGVLISQSSECCCHSFLWSWDTLLLRLRSQSRWTLLVSHTYLQNMSLKV